MVKYLSILLLILISCSQEVETPKEYPQSVGDIAFDTLQDDANFKPCYEYDYSPQYYWNEKGLSYKGEMSALKEEVSSSYKSPKLAGQTGFLRVKFLVNCNGETGLFRSKSFDHDMHEITFDRLITDQIMSAVKDLDGWSELRQKNGVVLDYYQYLIFKIKDSEIIDIMP